jgi:hypothetical protein
MGWIGALWGIIGVSALLLYAIEQLTPIMLDALNDDWNWNHWASLVLNVIMMAYYEGYKGFQKGFSPRVAARAKYLLKNPRWLHVVLAPLFCVGYFHSTMRRKISIYILTSCIFLFIYLVGLLSQPWRGIFDASVILGLSWGLISLLIFSTLALTSRTFNYAADLPTETN